MRTFKTLAATAALVALTSTSANAAGGHWSEYETRRAAHLPTSVIYVSGSAVKVTPHVRCFTAQATKRTRVGTVMVHRGELVGYCTDKYIDVVRDENDVVVIRRAH